MKNLKKNLVVILILSVAFVGLFAACDFGALKDVAYCEITLDSDTYEYTGSAITPEVTVKYGGLKTLQKDVDYTLEYASNIEIGTGYVRIAGIGEYKGSVVKEFTITQPKVKLLTFFFYAPGADFVGDALQNVKDVRDLSVPTVSKAGYEFLHWTYYGKIVDFNDVSALPTTSAQFEAVFSLITYTIKYNLNGGENSELNKEEYTVENLFELQEATREEKKFVGWFTDENFNEKLTTLTGVTRDLVLYAKFVNPDDTTTLSYVLPEGVSGNEYRTQTLYPGTELIRPSEVVSKDGTKRVVWYIDEGMTIRHNVRFMPDVDLTIYGRWEDKVYSGFLDKGWNSILDIGSIDSYDDMLAYVEFILFHNITDAKMKKVTYVKGEENIKTEITKALSESTFPRMLGVLYKRTNTECSVYMSSSVSAQATLTATNSKDFYPQIGDVFNGYESNRSSTFDNFAINNVKNEYECETTDQLFYILSHGYRPSRSTSPAYSAYNRFKEILRGICDDRMSDLQKARAIFDWLVLNVYYDNRVAAGGLPQDNYKYNAFYIEGVLNSAAVCDGLSKAYAVMCAIEGIDCVRVTGRLKDAQSGDAGHAWNKIQLMGQWYLTDATWGNRVVRSGNKSYEYVSGEYFLFIDEKRADVDNYVSEQYFQYVADGQYNYYDGFDLNLEISEKKSGITTKYNREFDLYIDGDSKQNFTAIDELSYVFEYVDKSGVELEGKAFCIMLGEDMSQRAIDEAFNKYVNRMRGLIFSTARITSYSIIGNLDSTLNAYKKGSVIAIVISLPSDSSSIQKAA